MELVKKTKTLVFDEEVNKILRELSIKEKVSESGFLRQLIMKEYARRVQ